MREILFRGKSKGKPEWAYGSLYKEGSQAFILVGGRFYPEPSNGQSALGIMDWYEVFPDSIGQFTGLLDKNNKKIFEGDIFVSDYFEDGTKFVVVFEHGAFCGKSERTGIFPLGFANDSDETGCEDDDFYYPDDYSTHIKVVGNIHDQKEDV